MTRREQTSNLLAVNVTLVGRQTPNLQVYQWRHLYWVLLPSAFRRMREGNVFTGICLLTGDGGHLSLVTSKVSPPPQLCHWSCLKSCPWSCLGVPLVLFQALSMVLSGEELPLYRTRVPPPPAPYPCPVGRGGAGGITVLSRVWGGVPSSLCEQTHTVTT